MMRRTIVSAFATLLATASLTLSAYAQSSTAFTYQGFLKDNLNDADGEYDFRFSLYTVETAGSPIATVEVPQTLVEAGLFTVKLDFGINPFNQGQRLWMEIAVRKTGQTVYRNVRPRIEITAAPYALFSQKARDAQNAVNAQNAQNAQNAVNAQNAQNAVNAQNAQNAQNTYRIQGRPVSSSAPSFRQVLKWTGTEWAPQYELWQYRSGPENTWISVDQDQVYIGDPIQASSFKTRLGVASEYGPIETWPRDWIGGISTWQITFSASLSNNYYYFSDERLKQNILPLDIRDSERLFALRPVSFEWKDPRLDGERQYGFIAQEVLQIFPEITTGSAEEGDVLGVDYIQLIPHLVNVLKKQQAEINELRAEIQRLRGAVPTPDTQR